MVKVKICGITNLDDAIAAVEAGADFLGFIFYKNSPRYIDPQKAKDIIQKMPQSVKKVAVFVNEKKEAVEDILKELKGIDYVQLHGDEPPQYCNNLKGAKVIKAVRVKNRDSIASLEGYGVDLFLLDAHRKDLYGGTGETFDWDLAKEAKIYNVPIILSGGLNPANVEDAIKKAEPYAVDAASGVESSPGRKDKDLIKSFIEKVKIGGAR
ncbi:MAG TPA: phosphoribosylanthranilate isomerase [Candidatus Omnitrophica bacterium]|nr:phosphoribosylanthranilate isomerase [Candidatus Omnitrophota bacterium]